MRTALLDHVGECRSALLFGDGDGRFAVRLLERHNEIQAVAVDTSRAMLRLLHRRCERAGVAGRLQTVNTAAFQAALPAGTDLIVTQFFLDCLSQADVETLVRRVRGAVQPGACWLLSDFAIPTHWLLRSPARLYVRALYLAFRLLTGLRVQQLPDPQTALAAHGFCRVQHREKLLGLLYTELWQLAPGSEWKRHNPASARVIHTGMEPGSEGATGMRTQAVADPLPDPEPPVPSLPEPDPAIFHRAPAATPESTATATQPDKTPA